MAKKITRQEIAENDLFGGIRSSAEETISVIDKLSAALTETADAVKKSIGGAKFDSTKAINNFVKGTEKANKLQKQSIELEKAKANAVKARNQAMTANQKKLQEQEKTVQQRIKTDKAYRQEKEQVAKAAAKAAKAAKAENSEYTKLVKKTRDLKNQSKELAAKMLKLEQSGKKNSTAWRQTAREYRNVTKAAQQGDKALKKIDGTVGDNFRNVGNYKSALAGLGKSLLMLGGGLSAISVAKNMGGIIVDFDQAVGDLAAISGKSREDLAGLTQQAKDLGATTQFSATQITEMQIELAKLGFTSEQISASTGAVANFAAATGADIPSAAALAGSSLRAFGLDANEMERVVSTLGVATTKSALDFSKLETGLSTVAPVAKSFGFSIEDTTALLGTLANSGFDASSAATATRNILLNLADSSGDLAQKLGRPIRSSEDLAAGLKELEESGIDLAEALELTDKRSVAAFSTFMENSDTLVDLKDDITDVNDELEDMAEKRLDTIGGQFTLLQSAWEGFVLSVNEGSGIGETIKNTLGFLATNLNAIMSSLFMVIRAWVQYKATLMVVKGIQWAMSGGLKTMATNLVAGAKGLVGMTKATKGAATGMNTLGKSMNAIPLLAIIGLVVQLAQAFYEVANAARTARLQQEMLDAAEQQATETTNKLLSAEKKRFDEKMRQLDIESRKRIAAGEKEKTVNEDRAAAEKKIANESLNNIKKLRNAERDRMADLLVLDEMTTAWAKKFKEGWGSIKNSEVLTDLSGTIKMTAKEVRELGKEFADTYNKTRGLKVGQEGFLDRNKTDDILLAIKQETTASIQIVTDLSAAAKEYADILEDRLVSEEEMRQKYKAQVPKAKKVVKVLKEIKAEYGDLIKLEKELFDTTSDRLELLEEIAKIGRDREVREVEERIDTEFRSQQTSVENTGEMDTDALDNLVREKSEIKAENLRKDAEFEKMMLQRKYDFEAKERRDELLEERNEMVANAQKVYEENFRLFEGNKAKQEEAKEKLTAALLKIDEGYVREVNDLQEVQAEEQKNLNSEILIIDENLKDDLVDNTAEMNEEINTLNDELIAGQENYYAQQFKIQQDANKKALDDEKKLWQDRMDIAQVATDFLTMLSDRRIKQIDKEIEDAEKSADFLRELAANGNIDAADSLAEQQRLIDEANRKKIQEEKLKAKIEFANTVFQTYGQKVQAGSESPLTDTIKDVSLLQQFIAQFTPTYKDGTEDTGPQGQGIDGQGGFHAILHPNERVLTKEQNRLIGGLSNNELARVAQDYQNGKIMQEGASQIAIGWNDSAILNRLESLENTIKSKPEHDLRVEDVVTGAMTIVRQTKRGNNVQYNRYKVKK
jgi:TP901 family phage tail tape measure protein